METDGGTFNPEIDYFDDDFGDEDEEDNDGDEFEDIAMDEEEEEFQIMTSEKIEDLVSRFSSERVPVRVIDVVINGNSKTSDSLVLSEVEMILRDATNFDELLTAAFIANSRLERLNVFDSVRITLDGGPIEIPGVANVIIEVSEAKNRVSGNLGGFWSLEDKFWPLEGVLKLKNLFGFGDAWEGSFAPEWGQAMGFSTGVSLPRFKALPTPFSLKLSLLSKDWMNLSSYKGPELGLTLGLLSFANHDVSLALSWQMLKDQLQSASDILQKNHRHTYFSGFKYTYKVDQRDSLMRPTQGHAFAFMTRVGRILPHVKNFHVINQVFQLHYAIPFGFYRSALNVGVSGGFLFPWKSGYLNESSYLTERFLATGDSSQVYSIGGPTSVLGFRTWGLDDATEPNDGISDPLGGYLNLKAFADFSFDLPFRLFREIGLHGHAFARTGCSQRLTANAFKEFTFQKFIDSFRSSIGFGIVLPTKLVRAEVNYCCILKQQTSERHKTGIQFGFSSTL